MGCFSPVSNDTSYQTNPKNPNPEKFSILSHYDVGNYCLVEILYFGCTNFEGKKLLVFSLPFKEVKKQARIDPHFTENSNLIARFVPTSMGRALAESVVRGLAKA